MVDVQRSQRGNQVADAGDGIEQGGVDAGVAGGIVQAEATQTGFRQCGPGGMDLGTQRLGERGPERRAEPGDEVGPVSSQAAPQLHGQRIGTVTQVRQRVADDPRPADDAVGVQGRRHARLVEAHQVLLQHAVRCAIEEIVGQERVAGRHHSVGARAQAVDVGDAVVDVGVQERLQRQRIMASFHGGPAPVSIRATVRIVSPALAAEILY